MNIERSTSRQPDRQRTPAMRIAVCGLIAILIAWQIAIRQLSKALLQSDNTAMALRVDPNSGPAQSALAASELADGHLAGSRQFAAGAVRSTALSPVALRSLMIANQLSGEAATSRDLPSTAGRLGWRDQATQFMLFALDIQAGRMSDAADRLDAIGRTSEQPSVIFPIIDSWLPSDDFRREMLVRLSRNPPWRLAYFRKISHLDPAGVGSRQQLAVALPRRDAEQTKVELSPYVYWLLDHGYFAGAEDLWRVHLASKTMTNSRLYDARFRATDQSGVASPFEWNINSLGGASATPTEANGIAGLQVETDGTAEGNLVEQRLVLPPGSYRFSVDVDSESTLAVFQWKISCAPARSPLFSRGLTSTRDRSRPDGVTTSFQFDVPRDNCPLQFVDLYLSKPSVPESMVAFFTGAKIQ